LNYGHHQTTTRSQQSNSHKLCPFLCLDYPPLVRTHQLAIPPVATVKFEARVPSHSSIFKQRPSTLALALRLHLQGTTGRLPSSRHQALPLFQRRAATSKPYGTAGWVAAQIHSLVGAMNVCRLSQLSKSSCGAAATAQSSSNTRVPQQSNLCQMLDSNLLKEEEENWGADNFGGGRISGKLSTEGGYRNGKAA